MTYRMCGTLIASLSVVAFVLAASETFADPAVVRGGVFAPPHPTFQPSVGRSLHHHRGIDHRGIGGFWPTAGGVFYEPSNNEPMLDARQPRTSDDIRYTCIYDIPWDYVHRCPQVVAPRE